MNHIGQVLRLRPGCYPLYKQRHDELWPQLRDLMARHGVSMIIFRHGDLLFVHGVAPAGVAWQQIGADPISDRWNQFMAEVLETDTDGQITRNVLETAFAFGDFA